MAKYAAAIDQGTTSSRCMIFDHGGQVVSVVQKEHEQIYPKPGWVEHDANEIWARTQEVIDEAMESAGASADDIAGVGITNQRETAVAWDRRTGRPVARAVVWQDRRTADRCDELRDAGHLPLVRERTGLQVAVSAGILTADQAARLAAGGVHRYNHNLETARSFFPQIATTHSWDERFETCRLVRAAGMELCCGALLGMGETVEQRLELLGQLREVEPAEVPVNFLNPRPGTPLGDRPLVGALEALRWIALFRLALPAVILRYAGGREVTLGDLGTRDGLLGGINAVIVGNYLTTLGRPATADLDLLDELEIPVKALSATL